MASFLEKFKGKTNFISKQGLLSSLEQSSVPIKKPLIVNIAKPQKTQKPQSFSAAKNVKSGLSAEKSVKSALLQQKTQPNNEKMMLRERKINSFSIKSEKKSLKSPEKRPKNVRNLVIKTETDLPPKKASFSTQKSAPVSIRNSPILLKDKPRFIDNLKAEGNVLREKKEIMEEIEEKDDEFEEAQRLHFEYLNRVEKLNNLN
jgi:hypothetical protein